MRSSLAGESREPAEILLGKLSKSRDKKRAEVEMRLPIEDADVGKM